MEKHLEMPLTRDFTETVQARVQSDPEFRRALLKESVESLLEGDVDTGRAVLHVTTSTPPSDSRRLAGSPVSRQRA